MSETSQRLWDFLLTIGGAFLGALLSFVLIVVWDTCKARREANAEKKRIVNLLVTEIKENIGICGSLVNHLGQELKLLSEGKEIGTGPTTLEVEGWSISKSGNILQFLGWNNVRTVAICYATARRINTNIQSRETLRSTSRALSGYRELIKMLNETIISQAMQYVREGVEALRVLGEKYDNKILTEPLYYG
jgi:hypothetical protein